MYEIITWKDENNYYKFITINSDNGIDLLLLDITSIPFLVQDEDGYPIYFSDLQCVIKHIENRFYKNTTIKPYDKIVLS